VEYGSFERRLGRLLDSFPRLRSFAKSAYQHANFHLTRRRGAPTVSLHSDVEMEEVGRWDVASERAAALFFGYFGTSPWTRDGKRFLLHRLQSAQSHVIEVCLQDRRSRVVTRLGDTTAWNFQQGSMAQWINQRGTQCVVFNDVVAGRLGCRIVTPGASASPRAERTIDWPVQAVQPDGGAALSINYRRLWRVARDYGYDVAAANLHPDQPLSNDGIWRVRLDNGASDLVIPLEALARHAPRPDMEHAAHEVNHVAYSPAGGRIAFMHRWMGARGRFSRLYCANAEGGELRLLWDERMVSHYGWRDEDTLLLWARTPADGDRYYLLDVRDGRPSIVGRDALDRFGDGHPSYSPDRQWIVTDSYPDRARLRHLLLWRCADSRLVEIGSFLAPWRFQGSRRCDLHPRWSPDGRLLSIDSAHDGVRRSYVIDVSRVVAH
jgi:hypothetical protein